MPSEKSGKSLPPWLKRGLPHGETYEHVRSQLKGTGLHSVCQEARCPNLGECWSGGTATFMVMGDKCTRACRFCSIAALRKPPPPDPEEPPKLAESLASLGLRYAVLTTVCRDDLPDQGAGHIAACIRAVKERCPGLLVEFLMQDMRGDRERIRTVAESGPDVLGHNIETVERLTHPVRDKKAGYRSSLDVLQAIKEIRPSLKTKSSIMLGLGEEEREVRQALQDLRSVKTDIVTLGQYLQPTRAPRNLPVAEYIEPERFRRYEAAARELGFLYVASGPFVRSSYRAGELFMEGLLRRERDAARR